MKNLQNRLFATLALTSVLLLPGQLVFAQSNSMPDHPQMQGDDQNAAQKTFTGMIVKSGNKLVLSDSTAKTSYQLDDQQKAQDFLNKTVKVTGVLDPSTGTIRVTSIDLA